MKISDRSKKYNVSSATLRYYESIGLIHCIERDRTGIREYGYNDCIELESVLFLKNMNMPLKDIKEYMTLKHQGDDAKIERKNLLIRYKNKLDMQINELQSSLNSLIYYIDKFDET